MSATLALCPYRRVGHCQTQYQSDSADFSLTGIGEVVLLPLDVLKIKMQTNPEAIKGRGLVKLITEEGLGSLYRGWGWTMARNAPGSFAVSADASRCTHTPHTDRPSSLVVLLPRRSGFST